MLPSTQFFSRRYLINVLSVRPFLSILHEDCQPSTMVEKQRPRSGSKYSLKPQIAAALSALPPLGYKAPPSLIGEKPHHLMFWRFELETTPKPTKRCLSKTGTLTSCLASTNLRVRPSILRLGTLNLSKNATSVWDDIIVSILSITLQ